MLLKMKSNAVEDLSPTVISNILYDSEIRKRSKYAFFRSVLPLVSNMRVFRRLVKIFRCLSVAARLSRRFQWSCLPSFFLSRSRLSPRGRAVYFCPLPLPTECCDVPSCAVSVAVSSRSVSEGADAAVSACATLYPSKSEWGSA